MYFWTWIVKLSLYYYAWINLAYVGITPADGAKLLLTFWMHRAVREDLLEYIESPVIPLIAEQFPSTYYICS